ASTSSACPPPPTSPNARSPTASDETPSPTATTGPATSRPGTSEGQPAGTGCRPSRCSTSAGLTPANGGAITTSKRPGTGSGRSPTDIASGPPAPEKTTHLIPASRRRVALEPPAGDVVAAQKGHAGL